MHTKFQSRIREMTTDGETATVIYSGSRDEMETLYRSRKINETSGDGRLRNLRLYQASGNIWEVELRYEQNDGISAQAPDTSFGKKSARLNVTMLSVPLANHKQYRTYWDHYLFSAPGVTSSPLWYLDKTTTILSAEEYQSYRWGKSLSECPRDDKGAWVPAAEPSKPGRENFDVATYSVTESARFGSAVHAGKMVARQVDRIGRPSETFGITGGDWKCDNATVEWTGKYWLATLTWTHSSDDRGWDKDLYGDSTPSGDNNE